MHRFFPFARLTWRKITTVYPSWLYPCAYGGPSLYWTDPSTPAIEPWTYRLEGVDFFYWAFWLAIVEKCLLHFNYWYFHSNVSLIECYLLSVFYWDLQKSNIPKFEIRGSLDSTVCCITEPLTGEVSRVLSCGKWNDVCCYSFVLTPTSSTICTAGVHSQASSRRASRCWAAGVTIGQPLNIQTYPPLRSVHGIKCDVTACLLWFSWQSYTVTWRSSP